MKRLLLATLAAVGAMAALPAAAQFQKPEDAIKYRQSAFTVMGNHVGRIGAMASGRAPFDAKAAAESANIVATLASLPGTAFGPGTDKGMPNRAKPEIWSDAAKFKAANDKMIAEVAKLDAAAKSGSLDAIKAAMGAVGGSCKACHDDFRAEKYSN
ncbi:c-type cytochrome [Pseudaquabacterium pictum]|uniref:Cytochrome c n=1 Tax=Pseudaquabacterium pictum TaxID=2315236 RepID=A0A480AYD7_9BURK|nr:cytochrome c [Rubrivivax pictus]GCL65272.1 cytochrome c [Rubrivivax pictus]